MILIVEALSDSFVRSFWEFIIAGGYVQRQRGESSNVAKPGRNHEFYKFYDIATLQDGELLQIRPNVRVYYNAVVTFGDVDIILSTMWAHIPLQDAFATESGVTDFHRILYNGETMNFEQFNNEHRHCMDFLREACSSAQAPRNTSETERGSLNLITHCIQTTGQKSRMNHHSAVKTTE